MRNLDDLMQLWSDLRGSAPLPLHSAFGPELLRPWLPNIAIVEVHRGAKRFYYRLAGSGLGTRYDTNFTGRWLEDMRINGSPGYWEANYAACTTERAPRLGAVPRFDDAFNQRACSWLMTISVIRRPLFPVPSLPVSSFPKVGSRGTVAGHSSSSPCSFANSSSDTRSSRWAPARVSSTRRYGSRSVRG